MPSINLLFCQFLKFCDCTLVLLPIGRCDSYCSPHPLRHFFLLGARRDTNQMRRFHSRRQFEIPKIMPIVERRSPLRQMPNAVKPMWRGAQLAANFTRCTHVRHRLISLSAPQSSVMNNCSNKTAWCKTAIFMVILGFSRDTRKLGHVVKLYYADVCKCLILRCFNTACEQHWNQNVR